MKMQYVDLALAAQVRARVKLEWRALSKMQARLSKMQPDTVAYKDLAAEIATARNVLGRFGFDAILAPRMKQKETASLSTNEQIEMGLDAVRTAYFFAKHEDAKPTLSGNNESASSEESRSAFIANAAILAIGRVDSSLI
jgi:hypothetical protein